MERLQDESALEASGLSVGRGAKGKKAPKGGAQGLAELEERYDNLVEMLRDSDDVGKERAKGLIRRER